MGHGGLDNLVLNSTFPQFFDKDSGRRAWPGPSEKGGGWEPPGSLLWDSKFPGAGGVDRENLVFTKFPRFDWKTRCGLQRHDTSGD